VQSEADEAVLEQEVRNEVYHVGFAAACCSHDYDRYIMMCPLNDVDDLEKIVYSDSITLSIKLGLLFHDLL
jgi:hypothetical protein